MSEGPLFIDLETRSAVDLKREGLYRYAEHKSTSVLCMSYAFGKGPLRSWIPGRDPFPEAVRRRAATVGEVVAHNAAFELEVWNRCLRRQEGPEVPILHLEALVCTMARAYAMSLPGSLELAGAALGLPIRKDTIGRALMMRMCRPLAYRATDGAPIWTSDVPSFTFMGEQWTHERALKRLVQYCETDVEVERGIYDRTLALSSYERRVWIADRRINARGIPFDMPLVEAARKVRDAVLIDLDRQMAEVTKGAVTACSSLRALKDFVRKAAPDLDSLNKRDVLDLLAQDDLPADVRRALELRREAGRAVSVAKLDAVHRMASSKGRVRGVYQYHGAGTGRWAGRDVQPHNLTRDLPKAPVVEEIHDLIRNEDVARLDALHGPPIELISKTLRAFVKAPDGTWLSGGDWSNIEGRGLAWVAGCEWKLGAFREYDAGTGPDLYRLAYARTFGGEARDVSDDNRQIGKVMELSLGYGGGVGAFQAMAGNYGVKVDDEVADEAKVLWRQSHAEVQAFWWALKDAAMSAVRRPGRAFSAGASGREVLYKKVGSFLLCRLPCNRVLCYAYPEIREGTYGPTLTYMTVPSENDIRRGHLIDDPKNTRQWARVGTFGGKQAENVVQAICRDILADGILRAEAAGLPVVWHTHDDMIVETETPQKDKLQEIMRKAPAWAKGFPLAAECWSAPRYVKG